MVRRVNNWVRPLRERYFRSEIVGAERIPQDEPSMVVGNHDGGYVFPTRSASAASTTTSSAPAGGGSTR